MKVTFDQLNVSLLNKSIKIQKTQTLNFWVVVYIMKDC